MTEPRLIFFEFTENYDYATVFARLAGDDDEDDIVNEMQRIGWRMIECEPRSAGKSAQGPNPE